jgi:hypothetical protein
LRLGKGIGHLRKWSGRIKVITQTPLDFLETHDTFHLRTKAKRVDELSLRDGIHQNRDLRAALATHFDSLDGHGSTMPSSAPGP